MAQVAVPIAKMRPWQSFRASAAVAVREHAKIYRFETDPAVPIKYLMLAHRKDDYKPHERYADGYPTARAIYQTAIELWQKDTGK